MGIAEKGGAKDSVFRDPLPIFPTSIIVGRELHLLEPLGLLGGDGFPASMVLGGHIMPPGAK